MTSLLRAGSDLIFKKASWVLPVQSQNTYCSHSLYDNCTCYFVILLLLFYLVCLQPSSELRSELPFFTSSPGFLSKWRHSIISGVLIPGSKSERWGRGSKRRKRERQYKEVLFGWLPPCLFSWSLSTFWKGHEVSVKTVHWNQEWEKHLSVSSSLPLIKR